ncbi:hypothetical protein QR685DRAFT_500579 [Neurospora intermedia]|uniref:Uncharacterized protein n=1 Tax=Neurospora intermedia TaxID=5142 RepID=A0ABR3D7R0_NEUIN
MCNYIQVSKEIPLYPRVSRQRVCTDSEISQREYSCGHIRWLAYKHCADYKERRRKCQPSVMNFEERYDLLSRTQS